MYSRLLENIVTILKEAKHITESRIDLLNKIADHIFVKLNKGDKVNLNFICTHNSRRSQIAQILCKTAVSYFGTDNIECFSGGTEATAFNINAVNALKLFGYNIEMISEEINPIYDVYFSDSIEPIKCFSKIYTHNTNPSSGFTAIMTCSEADENCPIVFGADARFPLTYNDPKQFDNTTQQDEEYLKTVNKIGSEIFYIFNKVNAR